MNGKKIKSTNNRFIVCELKSRFNRFSHFKHKSKNIDHINFTFCSIIHGTPFDDAL